nr:hypothetical protein [Tanacetum cinerariifolium]
MAAADASEEIKRVKANCISKNNLKQASTSDTQSDKASVHDSDGSAEYTELLEPIPEPHQVPQNDSNVIYEVSSVEQGRGTVEQHSANVEETQVAKFVRDFRSLAKEANESIAKQKALELEIERLLRAVFSEDIMSVVQNNSVVDTSNLQTELEPQLGDLKGKSKDTLYVSNTLDPLSQKLENENVELEFLVLNYDKENAHLKTTYKNLFDSISVTWTQTKKIIDSLQTKLHDTIYENAKLRARLFDKVSEQKDTTRGTSTNTKFAKQSILGKPPSFSRPKLCAVTPLPKSTAFTKVGETHALSKPVTSNSVPTLTESKVVKNVNVISPRIFRTNPSKTSRFKMTSLADKAILSDADNHPSMPEKDMYDSWKSRMELYMLNRQHGWMILESVENGSLLWLTVEEIE